MAGPLATNRWRGVVAVTLVAGAVGLIARRPEVLLVAVLGVVFAAYHHVTDVPAVDLELDRRLDSASPAPGEAVTVTVTVRNAGEAFLPDLRVVDGVPPVLPVVEGTPRHGTALRAGESASFSYVVEARHGRHQFEPATVVAVDLSGAREVETTVDDGTELACVTAGAPVPVPRQSNRHAGQFASTTGGTGVEFYHSREYRTGDPASRIDWNRYARRRELTTVLYREQRSQTVVALVDAREPGYRGLADGPNALSASVAAVEQLATALVEGRNSVGVAALGWPGSYLPPATGRDHLLHAREHLATHRAFAPYPPDDDHDLEAQLDELRVRLPDTAQAIVLSPLGDDVVADVVCRLEADGYPVTVISPDVTADDTPGRRLARIERANRVSRLRRSGVPVHEWVPTEPLERALAVEGVVG